MTRILFLVSEDWYFLLHHLPVALACRERGWEVTVAARVSAHGEAIRAHGFTLDPLPFDRRGTNPVSELATLAAIMRVMRARRPDLVEAVALKSILYGAAATLLAGRPPLVAALLGMGYLFTADNLRTRLLRPLAVLALRLLMRATRARMVVQNDDDGRWLVAEGIAPAERITVVRGIGVDLERFAASPDPAGRPVILAMVCRMLGDKGVPETVAAARRLRRAGVALRLWLVGIPDPANPTTLSEADLRAWEAAGDAEWRGFQGDIPAVWREAHVAVLPSHREGLPTALIEAAACARPIITSDAVGCRDVIDDGVEGFVVPLRDEAGIAAAMRRLIEDDALRARMGQAARARAEARFGRAIALAAQARIFDEALAG